MKPINLALLLATSLLTGCSNMLDKLDEGGKPPEFAAVADRTAAPGYQPMTWPMPEVQPAPKQYANSLWQPGARAFFRDQRAARVGDILRVNIQIQDKAEIDNQSSRSRTSRESLAAPRLFGAEVLLDKLPGPQNRENLLELGGNANSTGNGTIEREEKINTQVAATVTQVLPNGNLVIEGSQEIRVNYEIREVAVKGVVRPQDIKSDNTVDSTQIAEARINYGGRGQISNVQQPRWGSQVIEAVSPF